MPEMFQTEHVENISRAPELRRNYGHLKLVPGIVIRRLSESVVRVEMLAGFIAGSRKPQKVTLTAMPAHCLSASSTLCVRKASDGEESLFLG